MRYCEHCGTPHECEAEPGRADPAVEIARINADRDIAVARLSARQDKDWNDTRVEVAGIEAAAAVEAAAVEAEVIGDAIEASGVDDPEPVIIDVPDQPPPDDEGDAEELPPAEGSPPPAARSKRLGLGAW